MYARYASDSIFDQADTLKLVTRFANRNSEFSDDMNVYGHTMEFKSDTHRIKSEKNQANKTSQSSTSSKSINTRRCKRKFEEIAEIEDLVVHGRHLSEPLASKNIGAWLTETYNTTRGLELGTFDPSLLATVWQQQSSDWEDIALGYISDVVTMAHEFTVDLLKHMRLGDRVRKGLLGVLRDSLVDRYEKAIGHTKFLLKTERKGTPITMNQYFAENLEARHVLPLPENKVYCTDLL